MARVPELLCEPLETAVCFPSSRHTRNTDNYPTACNLPYHTSTTTNALLVHTYVSCMYTMYIYLYIHVHVYAHEDGRTERRHRLNEGSQR